MFYKINKLFLKVLSSFKLVLINIFFISILFLHSETAFSMINNIEKNLAIKYCDSVERNLFKGLDNERILKYEYFFNSINKEAINDDITNLTNIISEVETLCSYKLNSEEQLEFKNLLKSFNLTNKH